MRLVLTFLMLFAVALIRGQNINKVEYYIDDDPGYGYGHPISLTPAPNLTLNFGLDTTGLSSGLHDVYVRARDNQGVWSTVINQKGCFYIPELNNLSDIVYLEYFLDDDPGYGLGNEIPITPGTEMGVTFDFDTTSFIPGLHDFYIRAKNSSGVWSIVFHELKMYLILPYFKPDIVYLEYFLDEDPGYGSGNEIPVTPGTEMKVTFDLDTTVFTPGLHDIYIRALDAYGSWSTVFNEPKLCLVYPYIKPDIVYLEYFIDDDPGYGHGNSVPVSPQPESQVVFNINTNGLSEGLHNLYLRALDEHGVWSTVFNQPGCFYIHESNGGSSNIVYLEYFLDEDPGYGDGKNIPITPQPQMTVNFDIDSTGIESGLHDIYIRAQDTEGDWSTVFHALDAFFVRDYNASDVVYLEYYYDDDPGYGYGIEVPIVQGQNVSKVFTLDTSPVDEGFHYLYLRAQNTQDAWSIVFHEVIYIHKSDPYENIVQVEYFVDNDPGYNLGTQISISPDSHVICHISPGDLPSGTHTLYVRAKDEGGDWSIVARTTYTITATTWTGNLSTEWNVNGNWTANVPDSWRDCTIPDVSGASNRFPNITVDAICRQMTVNSGARVTVASDGTLTSYGNLHNNGELSLLTSTTSTGSFINLKNIQGTGIEKVQTYLQKQRWHMVSPPMQDALSDVFLARYLKWFNEPDSAWHYIQPVNVNLLPGIGYYSWSDFDNDIIQYSGHFNTNDIQFSNASYNVGTGMGDGWHMIGNPYPSSIYWNMDWTCQNVNQTIYIWNPAIGNYVTWNRFTNSGSKTDGTIPIGNGFWMKVNDNTNQITIPKSERIHGNQAFYKSDSIPEIPDQLKLFLSGDEWKDIAIIGFNPGASIEFDEDFDAYKLKGISQAPQLYTKDENLKYTVNILPELADESIVQLYTELGADGYFRITGEGMESFPPNMYIILEDTKESVFQTLNTYSEYQFYGTAIDNPARFKLHFTYNPYQVTENEYQRITLYSYAREVYIINDENYKGCVNVFSAEGKLIHKQELNEGMETIKIDQPGTYIVSIQSTGWVYTKKIIIL